MGWSHSVFIGQAVHEELVRPGGLILAKSFQKGERINLRETMHGEYIDDFFTLGPDQEEANKMLARVIKVCTLAGVPAKPTTITKAGTVMEERIFGIIVHKSGRLTLVTGKLQDTIKKTREPIRARNWNVKPVQMVLGSWT